MTSQKGGNKQAEIQAETALITNKRSQQSLKTVKELLSKIDIQRGQVIELLGITGSTQATKTYRLLGKKIKAVHMVVPYEEFKNYTDDDPQDSKVVIHRLNKRNQKGLTRTAVADLIESAINYGIQGEGLAIEISGRKEIIDSSRRFATARFTKEDLPLWVFPEGTELSDSEIRMLAHITTLKRSLSYREEGKHIYDYAFGLGTDLSSPFFTEALKAVYWSKVERQSIETSELGDEKPTREFMIENVNFKEVFYEAIRIEFRITPSDKTIQRYLDAAMVSEALIEVFPDFENISNKRYTPLKQTCKKIATKLGKPFKTNVDNELVYYKDIEPLLSDWVKSVKSKLVYDQAAPIKQQHEQIKQLIEELIIEQKIIDKPVPIWSNPVDLARTDKFKYVTFRSHKGGRTHEIKLARPASKHLELHKLLASNFESLSEDVQKQLEKLLKDK